MTTHSKGMLICKKCPFIDRLSYCLHDEAEHKNVVSWVSGIRIDLLAPSLIVYGFGALYSSESENSLLAG
jgi:hypothetical protein